MYVPDSQACNVPSSTDGITPAQIAAAAQTYMDTNDTVESALQTFSSVLNRPDLNQNGLPLATNGGIPATPFQGFRAWPDWTEGNPSGTPVACVKSRPSPRSIPTNTIQAVAAPPVPTMYPQTIQGRAEFIGGVPTTGNVCMDIAKGYVSQSQVSKAMLLQCSQKGYYQMGSKPLIAAVIALSNAGKLPQIPDQTVPQYNPKTMGLAGLGDASDDSNPFLLWASLGLGAAVLFLGYEYSKSKRRRR